MGSLYQALERSESQVLLVPIDGLFVDLYVLESRHTCRRTFLFAFGFWKVPLPRIWDG